MGASGYKWYEADCTETAIINWPSKKYSLMQYINRSAKEFFDESEQRAYANFIIKLMQDPDIKISNNLKEKAQSILDRLLLDNEWLSEWNEPRVIKRLLRHERSLLDK